MQDLLTVSIELTAIASLAYFSAVFVLGWSDRRTAPLEQPTPTVLCAEDEAIASQLSALWVESEPVKPTPIADVVVPFSRPQPKSPTVGDLPNWSELDPFQLRKECQARGIKWRNADPVTGKHLKKAAMVAALKAVETIAV